MLTKSTIKHIEDTGHHKHHLAEDNIPRNFATPGFICIITGKYVWVCRVTVPNPAVRNMTKVGDGHKMPRKCIMNWINGLKNQDVERI